MVPCFSPFQSIAHIRQRLVIKIDQRQVCPVGKALTFKKFLDFRGGPATEIEHPRDAALPSDPRRFFKQFLRKVFDPVTVGFRRWLLDEPSVQHFGEERPAFVRVSQDHIHHFVIPCVAKWFLHRAKSERCAQHQRVDQTLDVCLMPWLDLLLDGGGNRLKLLKKGIETREDRLTNLAGKPALELQPINAGIGSDPQLDLFEPEPEIREEGVHIGREHFVFGSDPVNILPAFEEAPEFPLQLCPALLGTPQIDIEPRIFQARLTYQHQSRINNAFNRGPPGIEQALLRKNLKISQNL